MGLLTEGSPLSWEETKKLSKHVREHGIQQFIHLYRRLKDREDDVLKWGDEVNQPSESELHSCPILLSIEKYIIKICTKTNTFHVYQQVEYILVKFDDENKVARVTLRADELLPILNQREIDDPKGEFV